MLKRLLAVLFLCVSLHATTTVTGNIQNLSTGAVSTSTFVRFWLRGCGGNQPRVNGTAIIAPTFGNVYYFDLVPNGSGAISGTLYSTRDAAGTGNGDIECGGVFTSVWYGMQVFVNGKGGPETPIHAKKTATIDISNITPISTNPVATAPSGDSTYMRLDAGNSPATGAWTFNAGVISPKIDSVIYVDGSTYSGAQALQSAIQACAGLAACAVDARNPIIGTQTFTANPFAGLNMPIELDTGGYTIQWNPVNVVVDFPSHFHWTLHGTQILNSNPAGIGQLYYAPIQIRPFLTNRIYQTTGSITTGTATLTVASATGFQVGGLAAVLGAAGANTNQSTTINQGGGIGAADTSFTVTSTTGWDVSGVAGRAPDLTILIGTELIQCTGGTATTFTGCSRGIFGTTAATHANGATINPVGIFLSEITAVNGPTITLAANASATVTSALALTGVTDARIDGTGTVNGQMPQTGGDNNTAALQIAYSARVTTGSGIFFRNWDHAGVFVTASQFNTVEGMFAYDGKPPSALGSDIWLFGQASSNVVRTGSHVAGDIAVIIDDRSTNWDINVGNNQDNILYLGDVVQGAQANSYSNAITVEGGSNRNTFFFGNLESTVTGILLDTGQWTSNPTPTNNRFYGGTINAHTGIGVQAGGGAGYANSFNQIFLGKIITSGTGINGAATDFVEFVDSSNQVSRRFSPTVMPMFAIQMFRSGGVPGFCDLCGDSLHPLDVGDANGVNLSQSGGFINLPSGVTVRINNSNPASNTSVITHTSGGVPSFAAITSNLKKGSGGGNYTSASTTYAVVDSTNLCLTITIPTGSKLLIHASGAQGTATAAVLSNLALTDNAACSTANAGILVETAITTTAAGVFNPIALNWIITGDGAAHNIALQYKTSNGTDSVTLVNSSATALPTMTALLLPSN